MRPILLNLFWKEYRELRWNVLAMIAIGLILPLYALACDRERAHEWAGMAMTAYCFVGGICFGMWAAAGERAGRSAAFAHSMPVSARLLASVKVISIFVASLFPIVCLSATDAALRHYSDSAPVRASAMAPLLAAPLSALSVFYFTMITAVFGSGQRTEMRAAIAGLMVLALWGIISVMLITLAQVTKHQWLAFPALAWSPFLFTAGAVNQSDLDWKGILLYGAATPTLLTVFLIGLYVARFSATLAPLAQPRRTLFRFLPEPDFVFQSAALVWKQVNETAAFVLSVLGAVALLTALTAIVNGQASEDPLWLFRSAGAFAFFASGSGLLLAMLLGIAAFAGDLEPTVNTFWRSRPISPQLWFWTKYIAALASLLFSIGLPTAAGVLVAETMLPQADLHFGPDELRALAWLVLGWFGIFSAAVFSTCILRRPLHAGLLTLAFVAAAVCGAHWIDDNWFGPGTLRYPLLIAGSWVIASIVATLLAWQAAIRDVRVFE